MSKRSKFWMAAVIGMLVILVLAALLLPHSFQLTALSDVIQCFLLASGAASFLPLALRSKGRMRLFWSLITLGIAFWLSYQLLWTYYEVLLRRDVPDIFTGDIVLFLHIAPMTAAVALRPHVPQDEYAARLGRLDFALLLTWWFYLYVLAVIPWQYVLPDITAYNRNLNAIYLTEKLVFLAALIASWIGSKGRWRTLYANLFGAGVAYSASSWVANWAIAQKIYYSGSAFDIPLACAMAWFTWIGLHCKAEEPSTKRPEVSTIYGVWVARCSMIAVFSLPLFATWAMAETSVPVRIRVFRLALTLVAAFFMGIMVLMRQHRLDGELIHLLNHSRNSFENLKRLQAQIVQSEKLASIGQLVGGAAHELNNPITAMLGYSDLLLSTQLTPEQQPLAAKIGQYVRRTKSLVASLISFARQTPAPRTLIDLNTMARTAIKLTQPQWEPLKIEVCSTFDTELPKVSGDSNQLLQVCLQLVWNCLHVMSEGGGKVLNVTTARHGGTSVLQIATEPMPCEGAPAVTAVDPQDGLGLSACQGILQEHRGQITRERRADGSMLLRVEMPAVEAVPAKAKEPKEPTVPVLWQSQPFA